MPFQSLIFLYGFLPIAYLGFWQLRTTRQRHIWLTLTGFVFYGFWNWKFCFLMLLSTAVSFAAGCAIQRFGPRRWCLIVPVALDLALLGFFKYANFALTTFGAPVLDIVLPVGISFYTLHTITYIVDCHRGDVTPASNFFEFAAYVSFFPQLVAGPISRFGQVCGDFAAAGETERGRDLDRACSFFAIGLAKKVLLADTIAAVIDPALAQWQTLTAIDTWLCVLGYAYQLYFDFSGYSDMAAGLGLAFGIRLPQNFDSPFRAIDIADFWRRWHISLSTVLRDLIYIPLGGSRSRVHRNLWITMLACGLWHGASWPCVLWGAYNAALLSIHRVTPARTKRLPVAPRRAATFLLFVLGVAIFRGSSLT
ncbi:MAG: MBOAT family O-acyltransferase, partial [Bryobacteraceae bacterium]